MRIGVLVLFAMIVITGCNRQASQSTADADAAGSGESADGGAPSAAVDDLVKTEIAKGKGDAIGPGQVAVVHYTGWLYDPSASEQKGMKFDSSRDRGTPFSFTLGAGRVIQGWDEGVMGMRTGGQRRLIIPARLGYGDSGQGPIPPNSTLLFDVELVGIESGAQAQTAPVQSPSSTP